MVLISTFLYDETRFWRTCLPKNLDLCNSRPVAVASIISKLHQTCLFGSRCSIKKCVWYDRRARRWSLPRHFCIVRLWFEDLGLCSSTLASTSLIGLFQSLALRQDCTRCIHYAPIENVLSKIPDIGSSRRRSGDDTSLKTACQSSFEVSRLFADHDNKQALLSPTIRVWRSLDNTIKNL